jgi:hypothetical protein
VALEKFFHISYWQSGISYRANGALKKELLFGVGQTAFGVLFLRPPFWEFSFTSA